MAMQYVALYVNQHFSLTLTLYVYVYSTEKDVEAYIRNRQRFEDIKPLQSNDGKLKYMHKKSMTINEIDIWSCSKSAFMSDICLTSYVSFMCYYQTCNLIIYRSQLFDIRE